MALTGCNDNPGRKPPAAVFSTKYFTDVPFPPGFSLDPTADQLAVGIADGLIRRADLTYIRDTRHRKGEDAEGLIRWYSEQLASTGWTLDQRQHKARPAINNARWSKVRSANQGDTLTLRTWTGNRSVSFRLRVAPASESKMQSDQQ